MTDRDPFSIAGATLPVEERTELLVVGAGHAGLAAALAAAEAGIKVVLVDENPVPAEIMGDDVPLHFGGRMTGAARNRGAMMEAFIASDLAIERAFDAGVDVRLGTTCWGLYANGPSVGWLPGPVAGLMDGERSWLVGAERIVVATGRRDMGLAFDGWAQPGVMGMEAAFRLAARYGALDVRRAVVLGSTAEAVTGAMALAAAGVEIVALVEPGAAAMEAAAGLNVLCGHMIRRAEGGPDGVTAAVLSGPDGEVTIACDAIILAVGTVPLVELLDSATCRVAWDARRGGAAPVLDAAGRSSVPGILAAGDCAGIWAAKSRDPAIAAAEGRRAALGEDGVGDGEDAADIGAYRTAWVRGAVLEARTDPHVCQCEEVTAREILEVRPPRYLGAPADRRNTRDLVSLLGAVPNPDQVKRLTRAGMGLCQGRRCREQVAALMALGSGMTLGDVPLATHRAPVRPMPLRVAAATQEDAGVAAHWDVWFGIKSQYRAFWDLPAQYTAATRHDGSRGSE